MVKCLNCHVEFKPWSASYSKYCSNACQKEYQYTVWATTVDKTGWFPTIVAPTSRYKRYLKERYGKGCTICGRKTWLGEPIDLVFDHINGLHSDWRVKNCRLICNNCDAQQPTFKGRNSGRGRRYRKKYYRPV
jgi:5-methylcytosine-specific restriction endonuclease McrA